MKGKHGILQRFFVLALANWMVEYLMNQYYRSGSHYPAPGCWTLLALFFLSWHSPPFDFDERLTGSNASCPNRLVGSQINSWLGSFVGSLIGCCNRVKWLTRTWFETCECIWMICRKKDCQRHQELQKSRHCIQSFSFHCFEWCPINILQCNQIICLCN